MENYTKEELDKIQSCAKKILNFVVEDDNRRLPRAFDFLKIIIRNIDICREDQYKTAYELTPLIQQDWKSCMNNHVGLMEYYFPDGDYEIRCKKNVEYQKLVIQLDKLISRIRK